MNFNALLALLEVKGIITRAEGELLVEHINNKPQSTQLHESVRQIRELLGEPALPTAPVLGPVGPEQANEEVRAQTVAPEPAGPASGETPTEFPTLPGANESTGNDLSISEMSDTAKESNETGNQAAVVDNAKKSDNAPASSESAPSHATDGTGTPTKSNATPKSSTLANAVNKGGKKSSNK